MSVSPSETVATLSGFFSTCVLPQALGRVTGKAASAAPVLAPPDGFSPPALSSLPPQPASRVAHATAAIRVRAVERRASSLARRFMVSSPASGDGGRGEDLRPGGVGVGYDDAREAEDLGHGPFVEDLFGRALPDDASVAHGDDRRGVQGGLVEVVGDEHDGLARLFVEVCEEVHDLDLVRDVQVGGGLVEQQGRGVLGEGEGDPHALALAAGELVDGAVDELGGAGGPERLGDDHVLVRVAAAAELPVRVASAPDQVPDGDALGGDRGLRQDAEPARHLAGGQAVDVGAFEEDRPGGQRQQSGDGLEEGGLAAGVGADEGGDPALLDPQGQVLDDGRLSVPGADAAGFELVGRGGLRALGLRCHGVCHEAPCLRRRISQTK